VCYWATTLGKLFTPICLCRSQWDSGGAPGCRVKEPRFESRQLLWYAVMGTGCYTLPKSKNISAKTFGYIWFKTFDNKRCKHEEYWVANQARRAKSVAAASVVTSDFLCDCRASRTTAIRNGFGAAAGNNFSTLSQTLSVSQEYFTYQ